MGTCYTYLLYEDFDWSYSGKTKEEIIQDIKTELPVAEILATWPHYIVIDLNKNWPLGDNAHKLKKYCDVAYCYTDSDQYNIKRIEFKATKEDKQIEDNKSANRNAARIEKAYAEYLQRYQSQQNASRNA